MKIIRIALPHGLIESKNELKRAISFASEEIYKIDIEKGYLEIQLRNQEYAEIVEDRVNKIIKQYVSNIIGLQEHIIFESIDQTKVYNHKNVLRSEYVTVHGEGLLSLKSKAIRLHKYFDSIFRKFALELGAEEIQYPTLLPLESIVKSGYLRTSPQYSMFVCHSREDIDHLTCMHQYKDEGELMEHLSSPQLVLSPAACFHCYMDLENKILNGPKVITLKQNVFRHEGRLNWNDFGRLQDYQVREIVFIGDMSYITYCREKIMRKTQNFVSNYGIVSKMCVAHDPFVVPSMQRFKKIQHEEQSKYELQIAFKENEYLSCASFNFHGRAFSESFHFQVKDVDVTVTGCVGFGLERWVLAFLSQFGCDETQWPSEIIARINDME